MEQVEGVSPVDVWGRAFQAEGTAHAKHDTIIIIMFSYSGPGEWFSKYSTSAVLDLRNASTRAQISKGEAQLKSLSLCM